MEPGAEPTTPQWGQVIFISTSNSSIVHETIKSITCHPAQAEIQPILNARTPINGISAFRRLFS
jgi:hypothetical protein